MFKLFYLKIVLSIGLAVTLLLVPHSLNAEDTGEHKGQVRVGVLDIEQATSPHSRELLERHIRAYLRELSKRTHLGYEYIPVQPLEGKRMLEEGSLDLLAPVQRNDSLQPMKLYSEGYSVYGMLSLFTVPGSGLNVLDSSTMNGITIGYVTTEDNTRYIRHYVLTHGWQNINYVTYANGQNMMEALQRGEIQAAMDDGSYLLGNEIELGGRIIAGDIAFECEPRDARPLAPAAIGIEPSPVVIGDGEGRVSTCGFAVVDGEAEVVVVEAEHHA